MLVFQNKILATLSIFLFGGDFIVYVAIRKAYVYDYQIPVVGTLQKPLNPYGIVTFVHQ